MPITEQELRNSFGRKPRTNGDVEEAVRQESLRTKSHRIALIRDVACIIGRTPNDLDEGCDGRCETDGGTCICADLYATAAMKIIDLIQKRRA